jgi:O-antigen/teichoic acid export membrane protein
VLVLSFIKQVYNYLFVAVDEQNVLFKNNVIGVVLGVLLGLRVIPRWNLLGGVITQIFIELVYTFGAIGIAHHRKLTPLLPQKPLWHVILVLLIAGLLGMGIRSILTYHEISLIGFLAVGLLFNGAITLALLSPMKKIAKGLTLD